MPEASFGYNQDAVSHNVQYFRVGTVGRCQPALFLTQCITCYCVRYVVDNFTNQQLQLRILSVIFQRGSPAQFYTTLLNSNLIYNVSD